MNREDLLDKVCEILGWPQPGFLTYDYFPLFPWVFVFLLGTWAGLYIIEQKLPKWFYTIEPPLLPEVGRRALHIYIIHQPILFAVVAIIKRLR